MENNYDPYCKQRGHMRSASLENPNSLLAKNTLGLPIIQPGFTGTLKSKNEQKRLRNKFGSYNNLEDYVGHRKSKFQNLRNMFEMRTEYDINRCQRQTIEFNENLNIIENETNQTNNRVAANERSEPTRALIKPIAFKPIPFEPDYSIPNRYNDICDRYGSTPSLVPAQGSTLKFGSTSDLRHGYTYCSNLNRRRYSRSLKINDSMESVRQTPDSDATSLSSTKKSSNKYIQDQFDITPSPSDSGISELEAALKDRDSELAYLRQTMEHNEKVIFKVHKDKEAFWEHETRKLKIYFENQQKEYMQKIKKLEQMLTLQSFQFKQNKQRLTEDSSRLQEQYGDLNNENELLRNEIESLKTTEKTLKDRVNQLEEKTEVMDKLIINLKGQLEENEWTVCQKNGEIALLKTQLKEAQVELTTKDHEMVHLKTEVQTRPITINKSEKLPELQKDFDSDLQISQLNRIIILKDQVILAMTSELAKLRKELSDLAIFHEYGEEPSGKYSRLKYKIDNLTDICNQETTNTYQNQECEMEANKSIQSKNDIPNTDLDIIINCLKSSTTIVNDNNDEINDKNENKFSPKLNTIVKNSNLHNVNNILEKNYLNNLPDVTRNILNNNNNNNNDNQLTETNNSINDIDLQEIDRLKKELITLRSTFEHEKLQWAEEKEKVMTYQRQLQMHYVNMYQQMKELENKVSKDY